VRARRSLVLGVVGALAAALFLPPLMTGLPLAGQRALLVTLITIVLWTTETLEPGVTALLSVTLLALTGASGGMRAALQGFANPVPYFLVGVLTMGVAVVKSGLAEPPSTWLESTVSSRGRCSPIPPGRGPCR